MDATQRTDIQVLGALEAKWDVEGVTHNQMYEIFIAFLNQLVQQETDSLPTADKETMLSFLKTAKSYLQDSTFAKQLSEMRIHCWMLYDGNNNQVIKCLYRLIVVCLYEKEESNANESFQLLELFVGLLYDLESSGPLLFIDYLVKQEIIA